VFDLAYWAGRLSRVGPRGRADYPNFVRPYVNGNKNDELDAEAICEATTQPDMRFVPVKTIEPRRPGAPSCA
jgi:transposase